MSTKRNRRGTTRLSPRFFRALCDPNRVAILRWLAQRGCPDSVRAIARCCPVDLSVVSRHLAMMRDAGILTAQRRGKEVLYSVNATSVVALLRSLADDLERCCGSECCGPRRATPGKRRTR